MGLSSGNDKIGVPCTYFEKYLTNVSRGKCVETTPGQSGGWRAVNSYFFKLIKA